MITKLRCRMVNLAAQVSRRKAIVEAGGRLQRSRSTFAVGLPRNLGKPTADGAEKHEGKVSFPAGEGG